MSDRLILKFNFGIDINPWNVRNFVNPLYYWILICIWKNNIKVKARKINIIYVKQNIQTNMITYKQMQRLTFKK